MITNKKLLKVVTIISTIALLVFLIILIRHTVIYSKYPTVKARITNVRSQYGTGGNSRSRRYDVTYQYSVDSEEYTVTKQVFLRIGKKVGKTELIRYNHNSPSEIENTYFYNATKSMTLFLLIFNILAYYLIFKNRKLYGS